MRDEFKKSLNYLVQLTNKLRKDGEGMKVITNQVEMAGG